MTPLVSVVIPSYNHAAFVADAVRSVLGQEYDNLELVVIDDGSTDNSAEILRRLPPDPRMRVLINGTNRGQSAVLNQALAITTGQFVALLPSDDWWMPCKLRVQIAKFLTSEPDVGVVYGKGLRYFVDTAEMRTVELPMHKGWVLEKLIRQPNFVYPVTPLFRRGCFEHARPDESYRAEGEAIYLRIATKYKFDYVPDVVGVMRDHSRNTGKMTHMMYADNIRYWTDFFSRDDLPQHIRALKAVPLSRLHRLKGLEAVALEGDFAVGRSALLRALSMTPSLLLDTKVLAALALCFMPSSIAHTVLRYRGSRTN